MKEGVQITGTEQTEFMKEHKPKQTNKSNVGSVKLRIRHSLQIRSLKSKIAAFYTETAIASAMGLGHVLKRVPLRCAMVVSLLTYLDKMIVVDHVTSKGRFSKETPASTSLMAASSTSTVHVGVEGNGNVQVGMLKICAKIQIRIIEKMLAHARQTGKL